MRSHWALLLFTSFKKNSMWVQEDWHVHPIFDQCTEESSPKWRLCPGWQSGSSSQLLVSALPCPAHGEHWGANQLMADLSASPLLPYPFCLTFFSNKRIHLWKEETGGEDDTTQPDWPKTSFRNGAPYPPSQNCSVLCFLRVLGAWGCRHLGGLLRLD